MGRLKDIVTRVKEEVGPIASVVLVPLGNYIFCSMGIGAGYHRLLTHRGFTCPRWFERTLALLGVCCLQDTPARWVAIHRLHHQHHFLKINTLKFIFS